jgi:hypothetical protein
MQFIITHVASSQHVSAVYNNYQVSSILLKLLHYIVCQNLVSRVNAIFLT